MLKTKAAAIVLILGIICQPIYTEAKEADQSPTLKIVVTTTVLECAVEDAFRNSSTDIQTARLIPPGGCPGHFDLSPKFLPTLMQADVILHHSFQKNLEEKIEALGIEAENLIAVKKRESLLIPQEYLKLIREIKQKLPKNSPVTSDDIEKIDPVLKTRIENLENSASPWRKRFKGIKVITSTHQAGFCRWLGFEVTGVMKRMENMTPGRLRSLMRGDAQLVVANLQSGTQAGRTISKRKDIPLAIVSNFPKTEGYGRNYRSLFRANLQNIIRAYKKCL